MKRFVFPISALLLGGCGLEFLFGIGPFDQTPPPHALLSVTVEIAGQEGQRASLQVLDAAGRTLAPTVMAGSEEVALDEVPIGKPLLLDLGTQELANLRIGAQRGELLLKSVVPSVPRVELTTPNQAVQTTLSLSSTIAAQLVTKRVLDDGSGFAGTPKESTQTLLQKALDPNLPAVAAFSLLVTDLLAGADLEILGDTAFDLASPDASEAFLAGTNVTPEEYREALAAAAEEIRIPLLCDTSLISVLFTVDTSGRALDGNGKPQFIRQPPREGKFFLAITLDPSSPVPDAGNVLAPQLTPNDARTVMVDDGSNGDEVANDGVFSRLLVLPRGMRVIYKYTNGAAGEGFTRTEEWPGNARILQVEDTISKNADGSPDCLVIRRDSFGDEASNKNFVNLNRSFSGGGGTLSFDADLGGDPLAAGNGGLVVGGLALGDIRSKPTLSPKDVPESRENGVCTQACPPPVVAPADDNIAPVLLSAEWLGDRALVADFSEAVDLASTIDPSHWLLLDDQARVLRIDSIGAAGGKVSFVTAPADFSRRYTLRVREVTDSSASKNPVEADDIADVVDVAEDKTAPRVVSLLPQSLKDVNPNAALPDPTIGQVLRITWSEAIDVPSASNTALYQIVSETGAVLPVRAAIVAPEARSVQLITDPQAKGLGYTLRINGVRDISGNALNQTATAAIAFQGFALFRMSFGVVVDFAFANASGSQRGIPFGEKLYLTGTPLAVARTLDASSVALPGRTDVTGVPAFEMTPSSDLIDGAAVYRISILVPPGVYAWKAAHGIAGEFTNPPPTLEKVHKNLATTNDATGVTIDPRTLLAANGIDYTGAALSQTGEDPENPTVLFKRENPDEVCSVVDRDTVCPTILVGTWRDILVNDYDDGQRELDPIRPEVPDARAPVLLAAIARDSESVLFSFDESLGGVAEDLEIFAKDADTGEALAMQVEAYGGPLLPKQQAVLRTTTSPMQDGHVYSIRFRGQKDELGNRAQVAVEAQVLAPAEFLPFTPLVDTAPPEVLAINTPSPTSVEIVFSERIEEGSAELLAAYSIAEADSGAALAVLSATLGGGGRKVLLETAPQVIEEPYVLSLTAISDLVGNVLLQADEPFLGFGDRIAPALLEATAISPTQVVLRFDEALDPASAENKSNYSIPGLTIVSAEYAGSEALRASAFSGVRAPVVSDLVLLTTSPMSQAQALGLQVVGVADLSGNQAVTGASFSGVAAARKVTLVLRYLVSSTTPVAGQIPSRAISLQKLLAEREGIFLRGSEASSDGSTLLVTSVTSSLGTFPAEGQPLTGAEPALRDDGQGFDTSAGDGVFTIAIPNVPLGSTVVWKAFASFSTTYRDANPQDLFAAFADATPGPSVFSDGQEFPGNDNAARLLGDDGDGVVTVDCLFGDEVTYKRFTGTPAFVWVAEAFSFE